MHDVLNVFMCTGFTRDTGQYFMKASPVRPGDFLEFFAEIDLLGALSACPGRRLQRRAFQRHGRLPSPAGGSLSIRWNRPRGWTSPGVNEYSGTHGDTFKPWTELEHIGRMTDPKALHLSEAADAAWIASTQ